MSPTRVGWRKAMLSMEAVSRCRPPRPTRLAAMYAACSIQRITCPAGSEGHADQWKPMASAQRLAQLAALYAACSSHCITCLAGQDFRRQNICQAQAWQAHSRLPAALLYSATLKAQESTDQDVHIVGDGRAPPKVMPRLLACCGMISCVMCADVAPGATATAPPSRRICGIR